MNIDNKVTVLTSLEAKLAERDKRLKEEIKQGKKIACNLNDDECLMCGS